MRPDSSLFHNALSLALDMGPETRLSLPRRLAAAASGRAPAELDAVIADVHEAQGFAGELGRRVRDKLITDDEALEEIRGRYPSLDDSLALRLRSYGYYLSMT